MGLVYFVTSSQFFIHARNKHKQRERALSLFTKCLIPVLFLDVITNVTQKMAELCKEYPFLAIIARSEWEEGKNGSILQSLAVYACFLGEWNPEMTSQSKLDPFSCTVVHGPKKRPTSLLWKGTTTEWKIQGQKLFRRGKQSSSESLFMRKNFGG